MLFRSGDTWSPLVEAIDQDKAPPATEGRTEGGLGGHRLGPGIEQSETDGWVGGPRRDQPPSGNPQDATRISLIVDPGHGEQAKGSDVVVRSFQGIDAVPGSHVLAEFLG